MYYFLLKIIRYQTDHYACSWQIFTSPVLRISTNTSDQRGGKDHHISGKEDGRKTAR